MYGSIGDTKTMGIILGCPPKLVIMGTIKFSLNLAASFPFIVKHPSSWQALSVVTMCCNIDYKLGVYSRAEYNLIITVAPTTFMLSSYTSIFNSWIF